jgi:hypothetical protein
MSWSFNKSTMKTDDDDNGLIRRVQVEDAIHRLAAGGFRSRSQLVGIVSALSSLHPKEIAFNVELVFGKEAL